MKTRQTIHYLLTLICPLAFSLSHAAETAGSDADKAAIARIGESFVEAFHKGDARAVAAFWTADGDYIDLEGRELKGREAIEKAFTGFFAENKGQQLRIESDSLRFPTPDTAIEDGNSSVLPTDGTPPGRAHYTNLFVKKDGKWLLASVRETAYSPPSKATHLSGLAWAIGEWVDAVEGQEIGRVVFEWTPEKNFIVSTHAVTAKEILLSRGTQWIGWDPAKSQVHSWSFESDGGVSEATWTPEDGKWIIKTSATLPDGKKLSATNVVTRVGNDEITWQSKDRTLDGKSLPEVKEVKMKRVP